MPSYLFLAEHSPNSEAKRYQKFASEGKELNAIFPGWRSDTEDLFSSCHAQIVRCRCDHAVYIGDDTDHLETLIEALTCSYTIGAENTRGDMMFLGGSFIVFKCLDECRFGSVSIGRETKTDAQIVWSDKGNIDPWD
jgi:hypothetical protein